MGKYDILLGMDWLKAHNPNIDWKTSKICLDCCPDMCTTKQEAHIGHMELLPTTEWEPQYDDNFETLYNGIDVSQCIIAHFNKFDKPQIA